MGSMEVRKQRAASGLVSVLAAVLVSYGCGDDDGHDDGHAGDGHAGTSSHAGTGAHAGTSAHPMCGMASNCTDDLLEPSGGDEIESHMGKFKAVLHHVGDYEEATEGTLVTAEWEIMLQDADGNAVSDADLTVSTYSIDCDHKGPTPDAEVGANSDGRYELESVYAHGGPWETRLMVSADGEMDMIHIGVCVPGEEHGGSHSDVDAGAHSGHGE